MTTSASTPSLTGRLLPVLAITCFLLSGTTGLLYETLWSRELGLLIGSSSWAHTVTLGTFMAGLGLGNALLGPRADRVRDPLRLYAGLELVLGLWGLASPWLFVALGGLYRAVALGQPVDAPLLLVWKLALGSAALLPPAILMGGTLPALGRWWTRSASQVGQRIGTLYFINTAGAVLGCALGGFLLVEHLGLDHTMRLTASINLGIGVLLLLAAGQLSRPLDPEITRGDVLESSGTAHVYSVSQVRAALIGVGVGGALSMLYELVWIRMVGFVFGSSSQSFSVMLMTFIGGIALGGLIASRWLRRDPDALRGLVWCELGVGISVLAMVPLYERAPYVFSVLRSLLSRSEGAFTVMQVLQVSMLCAVMLVPTTLIGITLPLASRIAVSRLDRLGEAVGGAFACNTLGTLVGVCVTGSVLMPWLGVQTTLLVGIAGSFVLALGLAHFARMWSEKTWWSSAATIVALMAGVVVLVGTWDPVMLTAGFFRAKKAPESFISMREDYARRTLLYSRDGADMTVTVFSLEGERYLKVNGKTDASSLREDMVTQTISGHLPMLLHPTGAKEVLVVGLGSGVTAGAVLKHPEAKVQVIELSEAVVEGAAHFSDLNGEVLDDPRAQVLIGDARDALWLDDKRYDAIISEPSNPWISGIANLFTEEFFGAVTQKLAPGGIYVQWIQLYAFHDEALSRTIRTLRAVFPQVTLWRFTEADALLVASMEPLPSNPGLIARRLKAPALAEALGKEAPLPVLAPEDLLVHQVLSAQSVTEHFAGPGLTNTDRAPYLEFEAPRAMFRRSRPHILARLDQRQHLDASLLGSHATVKVDSEALRRLAKALESSGSTAIAARLRGAALSCSPISAGQVLEGFHHQATSPAWIAWVRSLGEASKPPSQEVCGQAVDRLARTHLSWISAWAAPCADDLDHLVDRCAEAWPSQAPLYLRDQAAVALASERFEETQTVCVRALGMLGPGSPVSQRLDLLRLQGRSALHLQRAQVAAKVYREILVLEPGDKEARQVLGL